MPSQTEPPRGRPRTSRGRLRRSATAMVRVGGLLLALSLVAVLVGGLTTRSLINNLQDNSAELLDGSATLSLPANAERALYVTGGLVAPGEDVPTPVQDIECTVTGPSGPVPVTHLSEDGKRVGLDNPLARFQVVGSFRTTQGGEHTVACNGLGVVLAPEISLSGGVLRLGSLMLGSMGTLAGLTLLLIGGSLLLVVRQGTAEEDDDGYAVGDGGEPPSEGAEDWWEEETRSPARVVSPGTADEDDSDDDGYVELSDEELAALSDEEIAELVASGAIVFVDEDGEIGPGAEPVDEDARTDTFR